jgi:hypothetical protein
MIFDALRQQTLAAALSSTGESGAPALRFHAGPKTVLPFTRPL